MHLDQDLAVINAVSLGIIDPEHSRKKKKKTLAITLAEIAVFIVRFAHIKIL